MRPESPAEEQNRIKCTLAPIDRLSTDCRSLSVDRLSVDNLSRSTTWARTKSASGAGDDGNDGAVIGRGEGNGMCYGVDNGIGITEENGSRIHKSPWKKSPESSQRAAGKKYLLYSPSQERVRDFPNQETETPEKS